MFTVQGRPLERSCLTTQLQCSIALAIGRNTDSCIFLETERTWTVREVERSRYTGRYSVRD